MSDLKDLKVRDVIYVSDEAFDVITEIIKDNKPNPALVELMKRSKPWTKEEEEIKNA